MLEKMTDIFRDYKEDDALEIKETTSFEELGFDSLDTVELIMRIEEEFGVSIEMSETIKTVGDLMKVINANF